MSDALLVLNAGSSSLKFSLFTDERRPRPFARGQIEAIETRPRLTARGEDAFLLERSWPEGTRLGHEGAIHTLLDWAPQTLLGARSVVAVGHRVVHGGARYTEPLVVDAAVLDGLRALVPLAPLHQPHSLAAIAAVGQRMPGVPQVACFDTAFHRTQPELAQMFALPRRYFDEGVRRYGFHGLSYEYVAAVLPEVAPEAARGRTVVAHLGNGASLCALQAGQSIATTMSFTALDGLVMGTRCGSLDPGVLLYLMDRHRMDARALERLLYEESGLKGLSGGTSDMRELESRTDAPAKTAVELFVQRIARELGAMAAALGGLDALVFTAGIGEHSRTVRARVCRQAAWLGVDLDEAANDREGPCLTQPGSRVSAWVIPTDEERMIALHTGALARGR